MMICIRSNTVAVDIAAVIVVIRYTNSVIDIVIISVQVTTHFSATTERTVKVEG